MNDLHWLTAAELAAAYAARKVSPVELVQSLLERIDALDPQLNAFIKLDRDAALDAARRKPRSEIRAGGAARAAAWRARRHQGHHRHGGAGDDLPFENSWSRTWRTRMRSRDRACARRARSCSANCRCMNSRSAARRSICRFRRRAIRGTAIIIPAARRRVPARRWPQVFCRLRWAPIPAARSAIPPAICGVVGLKPTYGLVSRRGVFPLAFTLDHIGPMARTVRDTALALDAMAGHDAARSRQRGNSSGNFGVDLERGVRGLRVGFVRHFHEPTCRPIPK